jgi:hypothetical protein
MEYTLESYAGRIPCPHCGEFECGELKAYKQRVDPACTRTGKRVSKMALQKSAEAAGLMRITRCLTCDGKKIVQLALGRRATCPNCDGRGSVPSRRWNGGPHGLEKVNQRRRNWHRLRASLGLCIECDDQPWRDEKGHLHSLCKFHFDKSHKTDPEAVRQKRLARKAAGLCTECSEPHYVDADGKKHSLCRRHHDLQQKRMSKFNTTRKAKRLCYCGDKAVPGRDRCSTCLSTEVQRVMGKYASRKAKGLCILCGKHRSVKGRFGCVRCLKIRRELYHEQKDRKRFRMERKGQLERRLCG